MNWAEYAHQWKTDKGFALSHIEDPSVRPEERDKYLETLGDEWGDKASVDQFVEDFVLPHLADGAKVLEIGSGGGRVARRIVRRCGFLICLDVELEMLRLCRGSVAESTNAAFMISTKDQANIPLASASLDFVYSFDSLVHLDMRLIFQYMREASRVLKPKAKMVLHFATHETDMGWQHFLSSVNRNERPGGFGLFEYMDSHEFRRMADQAGFTYLNSSLGRTGNFYYERDAIFLLEKRAVLDGRERRPRSALSDWINRAATAARSGTRALFHSRRT
jgi:ubiquinone/menaquinone biosynthesis C-methylase UbiE